MNRQRFVKIRKRLATGILVLVPFIVTLLVIRWLFNLLKGLVQPMIDGLFGSLADLPHLNQLNGKRQTRQVQ